MRLKNKAQRSAFFAITQCSSPFFVATYFSNLSFEFLRMKNFILYDPFKKKRLCLPQIHKSIKKGFLGVPKRHERRQDWMAERSKALD